MDDAANKQASRQANKQKTQEKTQAGQEYRGFTISVTPVKDCDDLWDFEYRIVRDGRQMAARSPGEIVRSQTLGGHLAPEAACLAGLEVARTEVDNLLALEQK